MEPLTGLAAANVVNKKMSGLLTRVIGPSADEIGEALRRFTAKRVGNVSLVVENADSKGGDNADVGSVPERVAFRILEEGSYSDDKFVVEYLGGVLASSRTPHGRDDRGNTWTAMVARLSAYHLRSHFIFYSEVQRLLHARDINLFDANQVISFATVWLPFATFIDAMEFGADEDWSSIMTNSLYALEREGLIGFQAYGPAEHLQKNVDPRIPVSGIVFRPTATGVELFMWASGSGQGNFAKLFLNEPLFAVEGISVRPFSRLIHEMEAIPPPPAQPASVGDTTSGD